MEKAKETKKSIFNPTGFYYMVNRENGDIVLVAKLLISKLGTSDNPRSPSDGFLKLAEKNKLELSIEATAIKPKYRCLFLQEELERCEEVLIDYHYEIPKGKEKIEEKESNLKIETINLNKIAEIEDENIREVDRAIIIKARIGQTEFRSNLLKRHKKCQICGLSHSELLVASHIKPWSKSNNKEKLDEFNGLLLCSQHDAIFDKGYISFEENGNIKISKKLFVEDWKLLNIDNSSKISVDKKMSQYLEWHRKNLFLK